MPLPPAKLNSRHHLIAYMVLAGATREEVSRQLDYDKAYVSAITESPMFKALLDELRGEMRNRTIGSVVDRIISEGPRSVETLVRLRDEAESEQVRVSAARDLLDRNPETAKVSREDRRSEMRIVLDGAALHRITGVLSELDAGDVTDAEATPALPQSPMLQTLDQAIADLAEREAAEA